MSKQTMKIVGIVIAVVVAVNLASYFWARSAMAQAVPPDGGPTR